MIRRRHLAAAALPLAAALLALAPARAAELRPAPRPAADAPLLGVSDGRVLSADDPEVRAAGLGVARAVGARIVRVPIAWSTLVADKGFAHPSAESIPLSDPAHATYRWERIDAALRNAVDGGFKPLVYLVAAPAWALSAPRYPYAAPGTWAPRPADLADFASALARRYDGTYPDPMRPGHALPRVRRFQTWNEPNLARYLQPQWVGHVPELFSARWYRRMHRAAYTAIHARQPDAQVALAGLAPTGTPTAGAARVAPMRFLRALLCVDAADVECGGPLPFDAIAVHPLSTADPDVPALAADDLAVADVQPKLERLLRRAVQQRRLRAARRPVLWVTELNWTSADIGGVITAQQPVVIGRALLRLQQARAAMVLWQFVTDPPVDRTGGAVRPGGLTVPRPGDARVVPGRAKQFLFGFRAPAAAIATAPGRAYLWGLARRLDSSHPRKVLVERLSGGRWRVIGRASVGADGTLAAFLDVPAGATLRWSTGGVASAPTRVQRRIGRVLGSTPVRATRAADPSTALLPAGGIITIDPRSPDPDGPGSFAPLPPAILGGAPPTAEGPVIARALPTASTGRLAFAATGRAQFLLGTAGTDRLTGSPGNDLIIGLGGQDVYPPTPGRDTIVR